MGVVEGGPENLAARNVLEGRGDPPPHLHLAGIDRLGGAETRQGGAEGADQEDRLDHVAPRLLDRQRSKLAVVERAFGHDAVDGERQLFRNLGQRNLGNLAIAAALMREQPMGVLDGALASLDRNVHILSSSRDQLRGAGYRDDAIIMDQHDIDAARKQRGVDGKPLEQIVRLDHRLQQRGTVDAGTAQLISRALRQAFDLQDQRGRAVRIFVAAERKVIQRPKRLRVSDQREAAIVESLTTGALV